MIERFGWLHISDLHLKAELDHWGQNVVLRELVEDVRLGTQATPKPQFIVVSGDLAYSGSKSEYLLVEQFLDQLRNSLNLPRKRVFCVPGNHDIDRTLQKTCYVGALRLLNSPQAVEDFLGDEPEREVLLQRQHAFRTFEQSYCSSLERTMTSDGLGYVSKFDIEGLPVCVVALNSAWLCKGGDTDERRSLVGDRQIIDAIEMLKKSRPRLVIGVLHHPTDWLQRFDQAALENRLFPECDLLHRGHLHEPEIKTVLTVSGHRCVVVGAGAAFTGRNLENSYCLVSLDLAESQAEVKTFVYVSSRGKFQALEPEKVEIQLRGSLPGTLGELAAVIKSVVPSAGSVAHYLAAILKGKTRDIPIPLEEDIVFAVAKVMDEQKDQEIRKLTNNFLALRNLLRAFPEDIALEERIGAFKDRLANYAEWLMSLAERNRKCGDEMKGRDNHFRVLAGRSTPGRYQYTRDFMKRLLEERDWPLLESIARRHCRSSDPEISKEAKRMLVISLANAEETSKQNEAAQLSSVLAEEPQRSIDDVLVAVTILKNLGRFDKAKQLLLDGLHQFESDSEEILEVGRRLVIETGDRKLRFAIEKLAKRRSEGK